MRGHYIFRHRAVILSGMFVSHASKRESHTWTQYLSHPSSERQVCEVLSQLNLHEEFYSESGGSRFHLDVCTYLQTSRYVMPEDSKLRRRFDVLGLKLNGHLFVCTFSAVPEDVTVYIGRRLPLWERRA
jgi:hypothetical protein